MTPSMPHQQVDLVAGQIESSSIPEVVVRATALFGLVVRT